MDILEEQYGKLTFTLYSLFAIVPGKKCWPRKLFLPFSVILLFFCTVIQVIQLVEDEFKLQTIIELVPSTMATLGSFLYILYVGYRLNKQYETLLSIMLSDLREERNEEEEAIKKRYAEDTRMFVNTYTIILIITMCGLPLSGFIPRFLDMLIPLNESRKIQLLAKGEFFIDQEEHFYLIYFVESCVVFIVCIVIGISENMSVIIEQHVCSMIAVIGYRLEKLTEFKKGQLPDKVNYAEVVERRLHRCIVDHQKALQFAGLIAAFYDVPLTLVLIGTFCALTVSFVQVMDPQLFSMKMVIFTITQVFQLYLVSYMGQIEIDSSKEIGKNAYHTEWDVCSAKTRKMLQMVILRSSKPCNVVARGIYVLSIENFMSVMQTVTSCFVVLRQTCST